MLVCRPFRLPVPECPTLLRFYLPLIEPDGRISRIRLSDKAVQAFAHEKLCVRGDSLAKGKTWYRCLSGKRVSPRPRTLCFAHNH